MHYYHESITEQILEVVVYNHESGALRRKKDGTLYRSSVDYQVSSIRACKFFPPKLVEDIIRDPYRFFNKQLSAFPFDRWFLITMKADEYLLGEVTIVDVTDRKDDETLFLH